MSSSNQFPTDFVPVSRPLVEELGFQVAYLFGIVWNYCQMENGICNASHDTIAKRAGMSRRSVITHLDELIKAGYIEDLTPDVRNTPHHLSTKIGVQKLHTKERVIEEEKPIEEPEGCENPAHQNEEGVQNLHTRYAKNAHRGMQNLHKNRQSQETESIEDIPNGSDELSDNPSEQPPLEALGDKWNKANKTIVGNKFLELTHLKPPPAKSKTAGYWWGWLFEIFEMAGRDSTETCRVMEIVIENMRQKRLDITSPKSLINLARIVTSGQELSGGHRNGQITNPYPRGPTPTEDQLRAYQEAEGYDSS
jgi:DNA-binding Lrp family transcriptional regulator